MAEKRFQIFVSSTFLDLKESRSAAVNVIMRLGHIPAGMELFPATDKRQWTVIESAIQESDYYVLIVGGRYGSLLDHRSYTEAEYELALSNGIPIIPLLVVGHEEIFRAHSEEPDEHLGRLSAFRDRLAASHTCQYWSSEAELSTQLFQGLLDAIATQSRDGWVRGSAAANPETLQRLANITAERDNLTVELQGLRSALQSTVENIADLSDKFSCRYEYTEWSRTYGTTNHSGSVDLTWAEIFMATAPDLRRPSTSATISPAIVIFLKENKGVSKSQMALFKSDVATIRIQLEALGLIKSTVSNALNGGLTEFLAVTEWGNKCLADLLARRKN